MRYFANTGGQMPQADARQAAGDFPQAEPFLMYGLTEAFRSTYLDPADVDRAPRLDRQGDPERRDPGGPARRHPCDPGEEGELVHRGALVAMGYWNDPERTAERFRPAPGRDASLAHAGDRRSGPATPWSPTRTAICTSSGATTR